MMQHGRCVDCVYSMSAGFGRPGHACFRPWFIGEPADRPDKQQPDFTCDDFVLDPVYGTVNNCRTCALHWEECAGWPADYGVYAPHLECWRKEKGQ